MDGLSGPFEPSDISWLPGSTTKDGAKVQAMAYADLRAYMDRLDEVFGDDWQVAYTPWGDRIICNLTIRGVTRSSTGEMDNQSQKREIGGTVAEAQAFKRACAMFGLGRYLYNLPSVWVEYDAERKVITPAAKAQLDGRYRAWYAKATQTPQDARKQPATTKQAGAPTTTPPQPSVLATAQLDDAPEVDPDGNPFVGDAPDIPQRGQPVTENTLKRLHILGKQFYPAKGAWDAKRPELVEYVSKGAVTSSKELTEREARTLCASLEAKIAQQQQPDAKLSEVAA